MPDTNPSNDNSQLDPLFPEEALGRWRVPAFGDDRDDMRAALSAGADTTDDLIALECALKSIAQESGDAEDFDDEARQRALQSVIRLLRERIDLLTHVFEYLWVNQLEQERSYR